ncbi:hypothetical protein [Streptomyces sp. 6N223]|uniref:hypothetical protein n=1 Tax=Streptomyces sp. 6N223 TaxID=3457412 RepID=UPI003FD07508
MTQHRSPVVLASLGGKIPHINVRLPARIALCHLPCPVSHDGGAPNPFRAEDLHNARRALGDAASRRPIQLADQRSESLGGLDLIDIRHLRKDASE